MTERTLFDIDPETAPAGLPAQREQVARRDYPAAHQPEEPRDTVPAGVVTEPWTEVSTPIFLNWHVGKQLEYCARRDEHNALYELYVDPDNEALAEFLLRRAAQYRAQLAQVKV